MSDRAGPGQKGWVDILHDDTSQAQIDALVKVLTNRFPNCSKTHALLWTETLKNAKQGSGHMHHRGKKDLDALKKFRRKLEDSFEAIGALSPWAREALAMALRETGESFVELNVLEGLGSLSRGIRQASIRAEELINEGPVRGQVSWAAASVASETKRCWEDLSGEEAPEILGDQSRRQTFDKTSFRFFLQDVLDALSIGAELRSVMNAASRHIDT